MYHSNLTILRILILKIYLKHTDSSHRAKRSSTTNNKAESEWASFAAPETILQLPQQPAEEPAKRPDKKPKKRSRLGNQNLALGSYSCQRCSVREVTVLYTSCEEMEEKKPNKSAAIKSQDSAERRYMPPFVLSQHCDSKTLCQKTRVLCAQKCNSVVVQTVRSPNRWLPPKKKYQWTKWK